MIPFLPLVARRPRRRKGRGRTPIVPPTPPPPPSGAYVVSVHYNEETGHVEWRFNSLILDVMGDPLPYFTIEGLTTVDWDGWENDVLYTMVDGGGVWPVPGDPWVALANNVVQTEQGGIVAGSGMLE